VLVPWLVADMRRRRTRLTVLLADLGVLATACALVPAILLAHAAHEGTLSELYYYCVTYNRTVHLQPTKESLAWLPNVFFRLGEATSFFLAIVFLVARAIPPLARRARALITTKSGWTLLRGFGAREYVAWNLVLSFIAASTMYRFFPHYYVQCLPFLALALGATADAWCRAKKTAAMARLVLTTFTCFTLVASLLGCYFGERVDGRVAHDRTVQDVGKFIEASTQPSDRIFVWGFSSWLYGYSHRKPAGRYVFETYVTGLVPWFWEKLPVERARVVPGSVEALLGDLDRERPAVVVDAGSIMMARPMRAYPPFSNWLHEGYCFEVRVGAFDVYRRKENGAPCAYPYFPRPYASQDWLGRVMPIPLPRTADFDTSRELPLGSYLSPIWFREAPTPKHLDAMFDRRRESEERSAEADGFYVPRYDPSQPGPDGRTAPR
jgi:hypothetical protein